MDDLISRQAAIEGTKRIPDLSVYAFCSFLDLLTNMPSAEKKGKWIPVTNGRGGHECDQCHEYAPSWQTGEEHLTNYCPNCGAKMEN